MTATGTLTTLRRYPVKSMLGEDTGSALLTVDGVEGDRTVAVVSTSTHRVASAKHPKLWRGLLALGARWNDGAPTVTFPGGEGVRVGDPGLDGMLSTWLEQDVKVTTVRPERATVDRPDPEAVLEAGEDAEVPYESIDIGLGSRGATFVDHSPVHLITTATLRHVGVEAVRYRPNVVLDLPGTSPFAENAWVGREISIGTAVLRVVVPTPRCAVPTLAHGPLPRSPHAVRALLDGNRVAVPGLGPRPCLGAYAQVVQGGRVAVGDHAALL
jgi:uncharacterized protein YcbX